MNKLPKFLKAVTNFKTWPSRSLIGGGRGWMLLTGVGGLEGRGGGGLLGRGGGGLAGREGRWLTSLGEGLYTYIVISILSSSPE